MPFKCPKCAAKTLEITNKIDLPPDSRSDDISLQIVGCSECPFEGIAVYEESRRGAEESFDHTGYEVDAADVKTIRRLIKKCWHKRKAKCECKSHRILGKRDQHQRWNYLQDVEKLSTFQMDL